MDSSDPFEAAGPTRQRRVKELTSESLNEEIPLSRLANECGLSVRAFCTRIPAIHRLFSDRWLLKHRLCARTAERSGVVAGGCRILMWVCAPDRSIIEQDWKPHMDGCVTLQQSLTNLVTDLAAATPKH